MANLSFKRGIHPPYKKNLTNLKPIEYLLPKGDLVYPMAQHIGAPCKSIVKKGERVLVGQLIGEPQGFVSSPVHSSVSGIVKDIKPMLVSNGSYVESVIVENDNEYEEHESIGPKGDYSKMSREEKIKIIKDAGIVGMGGAGFPTFIKLSPEKPDEIKYIIINGAECEPYLTSDHRIMLEEAERVVTGLKIVLSMFKNAKGIIAIEDNKPDAIEKINECIKLEENIKVAQVKTKYPQGGEKQLIYAVTKREVPSKNLPSSVGCIVMNIDTSVAIHRAIVRGRPLMRRIVTVSGDAIKNPKNYKVRIGTNYQELIDAAGGFEKQPEKIISGGPMMGTAIQSLDMPIIKGTSAILSFSKEEYKPANERNCIRCGKCVEVCPMNLIPLELNINSLNGEYDEFEKNHGFDCIECGCCSYICPADRFLVQSFRTCKRTIMMNKKKK